MTASRFSLLSSRSAVTSLPSRPALSRVVCPSSRFSRLVPAVSLRSPPYGLRPPDGNGRRREARRRVETAGTESDRRSSVLSALRYLHSLFTLVARSYPPYPSSPHPPPIPSAGEARPLRGEPREMGGGRGWGRGTRGVRRALSHLTPFGSFIRARRVALVPRSRLRRVV